MSIPNTVTSIGERAFEDCSSLASVTIPESVTSIGNGAFEYCPSLKTLIFNAENCTYCGITHSPAFPASITSLTLGDKVTIIPDYFLLNGSKIKSLTIPEAVTSIGMCAFNGCSSLVSVTIPEAVKSIEEYAFSNCSSLATLIFNAENCTTCGSSYSPYPVFPSSITSLTFGDKVTRIPDYFLYNNGSSIECLTIPNSVTSIGNRAFYGCSSLKSVILPNSITAVGSDAFSSCSSLVKNAYPSNLSNPFSNGVNISYPQESVTENNTIYNADKTTIYFAPIILSGDFAIPEAVTSIGSYAFYGCSSLASVTIPDAVTTIGESAFKNCSSLSTLIFNAENCTTCGSSSHPAFHSSITSLTFGDKVTKIPSYFLCNGSKIKSLTIPNSVTSIGGSAFRSCSSLTSVTIPNSVTSIKSSVFRDCSSLTSVTIPEAVTSIGTYAFYGCSSLTSVTIPNSVTSIGDYAFYKSTNLRSLTLGSGLQSIGEGAFSYTSGSSSSKIEIPKVFWLGNTPPSGSNEIYGDVNYVANDQYSLSNKKKYQFLSSKFEVDGTIYVPVSPSERTCDVIDCDYSLQDGDIVINNKVVNRGVELIVLNVNDYSFYKNQTITSLSISNNGSIGDRAFCDCDALEVVTVSNNGNIESNAFYDCDALEVVTISNNGNIESNAFYDCDALEVVTASNKGTIGNEAFKNCVALKTIDVSNLGNIGSSAFYGCKSLTDAKVDNVGSIGNSAFYQCSSLPSITIPDNITSIGEYVFYGCSKLATVNIGTGINSIPQFTFANCSVLNNVSIPNNVKTISDYVFSGCSSLANLTFEDSVVIEENTSEQPISQTFDDWTSTNHTDSSTSHKDYAFTVAVGDILSFNYYVDSESGFDFLIVKINGTEVVKASGNVSDSYSKAFTEAGNVTLYLSYTKDGSTSSGQDKASVTNISLNEKGMLFDNLQLGSNGSNPIFADCPLDEVYIGRKLSYNTSSSYGYSPFYRNTTLRSVEITDAETQIYDNEFYGCSNLKTLKIGNGVKSIGRWAFSGCSSLDYFSAGYNVESIGAEAFSDCTGLTNYYSFSLVPPVCGNQALDDINKWECTLFVPANSSDEYRVADQWKDFFFIEDNGFVLAESITLSQSDVQLKVGETISLDATISPVDATKQLLRWSSSNVSVATVNMEGMVTAVGAGEATITATATDGSEVSASCYVTVLAPEKGDSNANGTVNIADAVNTANYAVGIEVEKFYFEAADVNDDNTITLSDASGTVTIILNQSVDFSSPEVRRLGMVEEDDYTSDRLIVGDYSSGDNPEIDIILENSIDYVALQADVRVPVGMTLQGIKQGDSLNNNHLLLTKRVDERTMRIVLFDPNNMPIINSGEPLLKLIVTGDPGNNNIEITNIVASDANANEYRLRSVGSQNSDQSGVSLSGNNNISIDSCGGEINIYNASGENVTICSVDGRVIARLTPSTNKESVKVGAGMYIVAVGNKVSSIIVR